MRQGRSFIALTLAVALSGCGGGGGGGATPPPILPVPPVSAASVDLSYGANKDVSVYLDGRWRCNPLSLA